MARNFHASISTSLRVLAWRVKSISFRALIVPGLLLSRSSLPLASASDMTYQGSYRWPHEWTAFNENGAAIAYRAATNTLLICHVGSEHSTTHPCLQGGYGQSGQVSAGIQTVSD